jgi:serine/threonine-protein kinase
VADAFSEERVNVLKLSGRRLLDRYAVGERVARGGMGIVFEGLDERLHRTVCVKVFVPVDPSRPEYATILEHFVQEAFTLSRLTHPNTIRIYDFGYLDEAAHAGPFFVTEFADGGTLTELVRGKGSLGAAETLRVLEPVVGALGEAHDAGIVHRDIKPSNILFTQAGGGLIPKLCDFSIAKATGDFPNRAQDTNLQVPLYSVSWAAPEQLKPGGAVGPPADVFALGLTTLFMLSGVVLYPGEELMQAYAMRVEGEAYRLARIRELTPMRAVAEVLERACAEAPGERYVSVESLLEALRVAFADDGRELERSKTEGSAVSMSYDLVEDLDNESTAVTRRGASERSGARGSTTLRVVEPASPDTQPSSDRAGIARWDSGRAAGRAAEPSANTPLLEVGSLAEPLLVLGNRRVTLVEVAGQALTLRATDGGLDPRIRVTARDVEGGQLHIKGLNCFVREVAGRATSGLDVKQSSIIELVSLNQSVSARIGIAVGRRTGTDIICELPDVAIAIPVGLVDWAVVFDLLPTRDAAVLYRPVTMQSRGSR